MQVIAWQTDMTRVTSFTMGRDGSNRAYREIGISDGHHSISHHQQDPERVEKLIKIDELHTQMFAYLVQKLKDTPDGDGTLLDHSLTVFGSSLSESNIHTHDDLPIVTAGNANGQVKGNRHLVYPKETPLNNLFLNMFDVAGVPQRDGIRRQHGTADGSVTDGCVQVRRATVRQVRTTVGSAFRRTVILGLALTISAPVLAQNKDLRVLDAVKRRDQKAFTSLMRAKADLNAAQPDGATALAWADPSRAAVDGRGAARRGRQGQHRRRVRRDAAHARRSERRRRARAAAAQGRREGNLHAMERRDRADDCGRRRKRRRRAAAGAARRRRERGRSPARANRADVGGRRRTRRRRQRAARDWRQSRKRRRRPASLRSCSR